MARRQRPAPVTRRSASGTSASRMRSAQGEPLTPPLSPRPRGEGDRFPASPRLPRWAKAKPSPSPRRGEGARRADEGVPRVRKPTVQRSNRLRHSAATRLRREIGSAPREWSSATTPTRRSMRRDPGPRRPAGLLVGHGPGGLCDPGGAGRWRSFRAIPAPGRRPEAGRSEGPSSIDPASRASRG